MLQQIFVLAVFISITEAQQCASCTNITHHRERCYATQFGQGPDALIDSGCKTEMVCLSAASALIGRRSIRFSSVDCSQCCAVDSCYPQGCSSFTLENQERQACCEPGQLSINLRSTTLKSERSQTGALAGVTVQTISSPTTQTCSQKVLVAADFDRIDNNLPHCGRRLLKIELELSSGDRSGWLFNIGDSISNNGWGGDSNHQGNDAEVQGLGDGISVYQSDKCPQFDRIMHIQGAMSPSVHNVTLYVSNEHIRITNKEGLDYSVCSRCLFALNGQADGGHENERIYIGLNRVVSGLYRVGYGVCSADFTWFCPRCD